MPKFKVKISLYGIEAPTAAGHEALRLRHLTGLSGGFLQRAPGDGYPIIWAYRTTKAADNNDIGIMLVFEQVCEQQTVELAELWAKTIIQSVTPVARQLSSVVEIDRLDWIHERTVQFGAPIAVAEG